MATGLRVGVTLPTFTAVSRPALRAADAAEAGALDGVFAFDHLWPMGSPGRPALWSFGVLGAVAARTRHLRLGPLVARVDLLPEAEVVATFLTLGDVAGIDRVVAGLGAGDRLSQQENVAYGLPFGSAAQRLAGVARVSDRLRAAHFETWIGGNSPKTAEVAGVHADALNLWGATAELVADRGSVPRVTWGGQVLVGRDERHVAELRGRYGGRPGLVSGTVEEVASAFRELHAAGASWCIAAPLDYHDDPVGAVETMCLVAEAVR